MSSYVGGKEACRILGIHENTLRNWANDEKIDTIRTPGGKRLYNVNKYLGLENEEEKKDYAYIRVSTPGQIDDMNRQEEYVREHCPNHIIIKDIGSGINLNRKGLRKIIRLGIEGRIRELVIAHKDRLTRFGYELIRDIIKEYSGGEIRILEESKIETKEEEIVKDVLQILNVYVSKINGMRKYKKM